MTSSGGTTIEESCCSCYVGGGSTFRPRDGVASVADSWMVRQDATMRMERHIEHTVRRLPQRVSGGSSRPAARFQTIWLRSGRR